MDLNTGLRCNRCGSHPNDLLTRQPQSPSTSLTDALVSAWTDFLDANPDDLTSPEDLPDHALVTCDQMIAIVENALDAMKSKEQSND